MPQVHVPLEKAKITGAAKLHPGRFKNRANLTTAPIGGPPSWLSPEERMAWAMFVDEIPWLTQADRVVLEVASRLRADMMASRVPSISLLNLLRQCCAQLGATPADRAKITVPNAPDADADEAHFH
jgi:phage terminase small subunit